MIVIAPDFETHIDRLQEVFERLRKAGLKLKPSKCELFQKAVKYLGHIVSESGIATDPLEVEAVKGWQQPKDVKDLQAFLGTAGYYRQYLPNYATVAKPLTQMVGPGVPWEWTPEADMAFTELKRGLMEGSDTWVSGSYQVLCARHRCQCCRGSGSTLAGPRGPRESYCLLQQNTRGCGNANYCVTRRELLAVVKAVKHFRPYLYGRSFKLRTDHASLRWLRKRHQPSAQVARWLEILSEFKFELEHRSGIRHGNADGLSRRRQCYDCKQCNAIEKRDGGPTRRELDLEWAVPNNSLNEEVRLQTLADEKSSVQDSLGETSGALVTVVTRQDSC